MKISITIIIETAGGAREAYSTTVKGTFYTAATQAVPDMLRTFNQTTKIISIDIREAV